MSGDRVNNAIDLNKSRHPKESSVMFSGIKFIVLILFLYFCCGTAAFAQNTFTQEQFEKDFDYLWASISNDYAYFDQKETDWSNVKEIYRSQVKNITKRSEFVTFLESVLEELYDFHTHLNTNTSSSPYLIPTGTDIWAEWINGKAIITEVRLNSVAQRAGLTPGMQVISIDGRSIEEGISAHLGKSLRKRNLSTDNWALLSLLSGRRNQKRNIEVITDSKRTLISIDSQREQKDKPLLDYRTVNKDIGYIKINNSLGNIDLIKQFDATLYSLKNTKGLIIDLRDTPSGGNTTVARGIMGRFINREMPYQKHSIPSEERLYNTKRSWIELVSPRGEFIYKPPVIVLVNHWTGSMGEGIAIGMDGMKRAKIVGTKMARLIGATSSITLPNTKIGVNFPTEKLFHIDGRPREKFIPTVMVDMLKKENQKTEDAIFEVGLKVLQSFIQLNAAQ
jgi:carboxyl-terminal processing protease